MKKIASVSVMFVAFGCASSSDPSKSQGGAGGKADGDQTVAEQGDSCGGLAGIQCDVDLICQLAGNYPDADGTCVPAPGTLGGSCGGLASVQCDDGLVCQLAGNYPDADGMCVPAPGTYGGLCGGLSNVQCQDGLTCVLAGDYPDADGSCE